MNNKEKKKIQKEYAKKNIEHFFSLLKNRFKPEFDKKYIKEILKFSQAFNLRLVRSEKLLFCPKCFVYLDNLSKTIRINKNTLAVEHTCKNCKHTRRFRYK